MSLLIIRNPLSSRLQLCGKLILRAFLYKSTKCPWRYHFLLMSCLWEMMAVCCFLLSLWQQAGMGKENTVMYGSLSLLSDGNSHLHWTCQRAPQYTYSSSTGHNLNGTCTLLEYFCVITYSYVILHHTKREFIFCSHMQNIWSNIKQSNCM